MMYVDTAKNEVQNNWFEGASPVSDAEAETVLAATTGKTKAKSLMGDFQTLVLKHARAGSDHRNQVAAEFRAAAEESSEGSKAAEGN